MSFGFYFFWLRCRDIVLQSHELAVLFRFFKSISSFVYPKISLGDHKHGIDKGGANFASSQQLISFFLWIILDQLKCQVPIDHDSRLQSVARFKSEDFIRVHTNVRFGDRCAYPAAFWITRVIGDTDLAFNQ